MSRNENHDIALVWRYQDEKPSLLLRFPALTSQDLERLDFEMRVSKIFKPVQRLHDHARFKVVARGKSQELEACQRNRPPRARKLSRLEGLTPEGLLDETAVRRAARQKRKAEQAELEFAEEAGGRRRSRRRGGLAAG